jgi:type VI secretion system protein ImpL
MKLSRTIWIAIGALLLWFLLTWLLGGWIGLRTPALYYLRGGLWIIGIVGFVGFLLLRPKGNPQTVISAGELDDNFSEATKRLQANGIRQLASLPAVFFLGDGDAAKTSVILKSDIAQLLAGQAQQDVNIIPTRAVNFWVAKNTIFVDPAGGLLTDAASRKKLFKKFSSVALKSVVGSGRLPSRSVVFTVSCEAFLQKGSADGMAAKAREFQSVLAELAQEIGSSFPVYVLFTKADKIQYFRDFVENLSEQEVSDVFGVTLPMEAQLGVYAEQQNRRVADGFQQLYYWLSNQRAPYLAREHKPAALPNIYEFPREFNKLREIVTTFLVDLCRPSQLGISPFLRGFYFTGIRQLTVNDVATASAQVPIDDSGSDSGATRMFTFKDRGVPLAAESRDFGSRKVPQWVFLPHLLPAVVLADGATGGRGDDNVKLNVARRALLGSVIAAALLMSVWWVISFSNNRALVNGALEAAKGVPAGIGGTIPPLDSLQRLTKVKDTLATLESFGERGRPLSYGAFLYSADDARDSVRKTYYGLFRRLLLAPTQSRLVQVCSNPSDAQSQEYLYNALKAYLVTTERHDQSKPEFLAPALLVHWKKDQAMESLREQLALQNFDFYARELLKENEYLPGTKADGTAIVRCREYLNKFGQTSTIYQAMLTDARAVGKPIIFNVDYPGTAATVLNSYKVEAPFTKSGFGDFENLLKHPGKYFHGEDWVLGPTSETGLDEKKLVPELRARYRSDFIKTWQEYLQATKVRPYEGLHDAVKKLDPLSSARSPLLLALCVAGENTAVKDIGDSFQAVQVVTPPGCLQSPVGEGVKPYMTQLVKLSEDVKVVDPREKAKPEDMNSAKKTAEDASAVVKNMALGFKGVEDTVVEKLLDAPIYYLTPYLKPVMDQSVNALAASMCEELNPILAKYPFNSKSHEDATLEDLNKILKRPEGMFWKLVNNEKVKPLLAQLGDRFSADPSAQNPARPQFLAFLNRLSQMSSALYSRDAGQTAGFTFTMKPVPSPDVEHIALKIDGQNQNTDSTGVGTAEFPWPGDKEGVDLSARFVGGSNFNIAHKPGLWGLWRFVESGDEIKENEFEWKLTQGKDVVTTTLGHPAAVRFTLDPAKAHVLRPQYFNLSCVSRAN